MSAAGVGATARRRLAGVVFLLVPVVFVWATVAYYHKDFTKVDTITLETDSVGNEMHVNADVKLRGVVVGEVRKITADGSGAKLELALQPDKVGMIPSNVTAQMLPTTLFGERFVALVPPARASTQPLAAGSTISQDRSRNAIELEQVLDNTLPLLDAVKPQDLSATLNAVATALQGRGTELGKTLVQVNAYLKKFNPQLPTLDTDIRQLADVSNAYTTASPDLVQALSDFTRTSRTVVDEQTNLAALYSTMTGTSQDLTTFLQNNESNIIQLSAVGKPTLRLLAEYSPEFPCTLSTLANFVPTMDKVLGKGTDEPGLHVSVDVVPSPGKYVPGKDTPVYDKSGGPRCYPVPYTGKSSSTGVQPAARQSVRQAANQAVTVEQGGLGLPNSPQENELVNELLAPSMKTTPSSLPNWSSVLAGPVLRGAEVTLK